MIDEYPTFQDLMMAHNGDRDMAENYVLERVYYGESV